MHIIGPVRGFAQEAEALLRSLPDWFGIEESLLEYASNTNTLPAFTVRLDDLLVGFIALRQHFPGAWEIDCIAVHASSRNRGAGKALWAAAEEWLCSQGGQLLQVKTLAASHPSEAYAETRRFYEAAGFQPLEVFPSLWGEGLPVLVYVKDLRP